MSMAGAFAVVALWLRYTAGACHNQMLKLIAKRLKERGKPHKLVIIAVARRLVAIANAVLKTATPWRPSPAA